MEKKKIVGFIFLLLILSIIISLVVMFFVWKNALLLACSPTGDKISIADYPVVCTEFMPAPFFEQFWIFLKNLFNPITWDLIF